MKDFSILLTGPMKLKKQVKEQFLSEKDQEPRVTIMKEKYSKEKLREKESYTCMQM